MDLKQFLMERLSTETEIEEAKDIKELSDKVDDLEEKTEKAEKKAEAAEKRADDAEEEANKADESIKDEKDFRAAAEAKFKAVFGDKLDKDKMKETIDGLLKDNKELVEAGNWGELIGMLNKSFGA